MKNLNDVFIGFVGKTLNTEELTTWGAELEKRSLWIMAATGYENKNGTNVPVVLKSASTGFSNRELSRIAGIISTKEHGLLLKVSRDRKLVWFYDTKEVKTSVKKLTWCLNDLSGCIVSEV